MAMEVTGQGGKNAQLNDTVRMACGKILLAYELKFINIFIYEKTF